MTDRMSSEFVRAELVAALTRLALPAAEQAHYLEGIGTAPSADELILELDDFMPMSPTAVHDGVLSESEAHAVKLVSEFADSFSGSDYARLWNIGELATAQQWQDLRRLASTALEVLGSRGKEGDCEPS